MYICISYHDIFKQQDRLGWLGVLQPVLEQFGFELVALSLTRVVGGRYKLVLEPMVSALSLDVSYKWL
jgi:hypothetical protein